LDQTKGTFYCRVASLINENGTVSRIIGTEVADTYINATGDANALLQNIQSYNGTSTTTAGIITTNPGDGDLVMAFDASGTWIGHNDANNSSALVMSTGHTEISFGSYSSGLSPIGQGHIAEIRYYNTRENIQFLEDLSNGLIVVPLPEASRTIPVKIENRILEIRSES
jgi:hypothetical protein